MARPKAQFVLTPQQKQEICNQYQSGLTLRKIAENYSVSFVRIGQIVRTAGIKRPARSTHSWKLTEEQKHQIASMYNAGMMGRQICDSFGVRNAEVYRVLRRLGIKSRTSWALRARIPLDESAFDDVTEDSAYWMGFLMADGSVQRKDRVKLCLAIADIGHIEKFKIFLKAGHEIKRFHYKHPKSRPGAGLTIHSQKIVARLAEFGVVPNKTFTAKVINLEMNRHFWRGVIDGDGSLIVHKASKKNRKSYPGISLCGAKPLVSQFLEFAGLIAPEIRVNIRRKENIWKVSFIGRPAIKIIRELYLDSTIYLSRKYERAISLNQLFPLY